MDVRFLSPVRSPFHQLPPPPRAPHYPVASSQNPPAPFGVSLEVPGWQHPLLSAQSNFAQAVSWTVKKPTAIPSLCPLSPRMRFVPALQDHPAPKHTAEAPGPLLRKASPWQPPKLLVPKAIKYLRPWPGPRVPRMFRHFSGALQCIAKAMHHLLPSISKSFCSKDFFLWPQ